MQPAHDPSAPATPSPQGETASSIAPQEEAHAEGSSPPAHASPSPPGSAPIDPTGPLPIVLFVPEGGSHGRVGELVRQALLDVQRSGPRSPVAWQLLSAPVQAPALAPWLMERVPPGGLLLLAPLPEPLRRTVYREALARGVPLAELAPALPGSPEAPPRAPPALLTPWPLEAPALLRHAATFGARTLGLLLPRAQQGAVPLVRQSAEAAGLRLLEVVTYAPGETAFAEAAKALAAARPDAVLLVGRAVEVRLMVPALQLAGSARRGRPPWTPLWLLPSGAYGPHALAQNLRPLLGARVAHPMEASALDALERHHTDRLGQLPRAAFLYHAAAALHCLQDAARALRGASDRAVRAVRACTPRPERIHVLRLCRREGRPTLCPPHPMAQPRL